MKLVNRKTRKAIAKSVRKAMKKHGPTIMAGLASGLASTLATLAKTEDPEKPGKSNLARVADQVGDSLAQNGHSESRDRDPEKKRKHRPTEPTESTHTDLR